MENKSMRRTLYRALRKTGVQRESIQLEASFSDDLHFDQLDWTLYVYYLEGLFQVKLTEKEIEQMKLVGDTLKVLNNKTYIGCN